MNELIERAIGCPYCAEVIEVLVDNSIPRQNYIEDCQVCCRPIIFDVVVDQDGDVMLSVAGENE